MKNIGIKTKEKITENIELNDKASPERYAVDKVSEKMRAAAETVAVDSEKVSRKVAGEAKTRIKEKRAKKKEAVKNHIDDTIYNVIILMVIYMSNNQKAIIGSRIMQRRKEKHIKQSEIAEMLNVSENQISNIENDKSFPGLQNF